MVAEIKVFNNNPRLVANDTLVRAPGRVSRLDGKHLKFVEDKQMDLTEIGTYLQASKNANHWSNFGPVSQQLEKEIHRTLNLDEGLSVVMCASGTAALHAVISLHETISDRALRWASSSFGFYTSAQGPLQSAAIVDCNENGMLDLEQLNPDSIDGFVVTNTFGQARDLSDYYRFAATHGKIMCVDSALSFGSHKHGANECISFHHTKPWGFGEGGCAIVAREHEQLLRSLISFGHEPGLDINRRATNGKISDIACAFGLMRLRKMKSLGQEYLINYSRIVDAGLSVGLKVLGDVQYHPGIPASVPFLLPNAKADFSHPILPTGRYYHPLAETPVARSIYDRIVNIPCHADMSAISDGDLRTAMAHFV